jgi:hypothetical protein
MPRGSSPQTIGRQARVQSDENRRKTPKVAGPMAGRRSGAADDPVGGADPASRSVARVQ